MDAIINALIPKIQTILKLSKEKKISWDATGNGRYRLIRDNVCFEIKETKLIAITDSQVKFSIFNSNNQVYEFTTKPYYEDEEEKQLCEVLKDLYRFLNEKQRDEILSIIDSSINFSTQSKDTATAEAGK